MSLQQGPQLPEAYETLNVGIVLFDPDSGTILDANDELESLFGYRTAELRTMNPDRFSANTFSAEPDEPLERIRKTAEGDPQEFKWRVKQAEGELIWVRFHLSRIELAGSTYVLAEVHDITAHYTASRRSGLLSRLLRHNVRNDVNVIAGRTQQILTVTRDEQVRQHAKTVQSKAMDFVEMADSIKQIDQATATDRAPEPGRAVDAVAAVVDDVRAAYSAAEVSVTEERRMRISMATAFDHALRHAIENAIVHSTDETPVVDVSVGASPNTGRVEIQVADDNHPIPTAELDALDEFTETTSTNHGSGVGLFVMKWCIESMGGELEIDRGVREGNLVSFYLPPKDPTATT
ncbi:MAG: PAS domain S-box protein [Halopenitus sp.]